MSRQYLVLTAVGPDRPGLVDSITGYVFQRGGNVEASRMATLGGEFAILMLVSGEADAADRIAGDIDTLTASARLACQTRPTTAPQLHKALPESLAYDLAVASMDHPGIVQAVAHYLAERGVNIESLDTHVESAPHTGTSVFHLAARLDVPASLNIPRFRQELNALAESLNVDVTLTVAPD